MSEEVTYRKACRHEATATGPALFCTEGMRRFLGARDNQHEVTITVDLVPLACDHCGEPWVKVETR